MSIHRKLQYILGILGILFFLGCPLRAEAEEGLYVDNLRINQLSVPYGVPEDSVKFSWSIQSDRNDTRQVGYRIVISKTENQMRAENYMFDSGWVATDSNQGVSLNLDLEENQLYYWRIRVSDNYGRTSEWSEMQPFSTEAGVTWKNTQGIWYGSDDYLFLRWQRSLNLDNVEKVLFSATAVSPENTRQYVYNLYVNGYSVGVGPARIDGKILYYNTYDVTGYMKSGQNVVGVICYSESGHAFLGQMTVYYKDGTKKILANTGINRTEWKALPGDAAFGNNSEDVGVSGYYMQAAENMNSNEYPHGWQEEEYSILSWVTPVAVTGCSSYQLEPYPSENVMRYKIIPENVKKLSDGSYLVDFGKEITGSISIKMNCDSSQKITVYYGEELAEDGTVRYNMGTGNHYLETWTLKKGTQELTAINMKSFRYVQLKGAGTITKDNVTGLQLRQAFSEEDSDFSCSNTILNDEYDLSKYTIEATSQDMYVDTQTRERQNYSGDLLINMMTAFSMENDYSLAAHSLDYALNHPIWPAEYLLYSVQASWQYYQYSGDIDFLREHYELLKNNMNQFTIDGTGLVIKPEKSVLIDWPEGERDGYRGSDAYYNTVLNAVYVGACESMQLIAETLGNSSDLSLYQNKYNTVKSSMITRLYHADIGRFSDGLTSSGQRIDHYAQQATTFALAFGIYSDQDMADRLAESICQDGLNQTSVYATYFMLQGLYRSNQGSLARQIMSDPSDYEGSHTWANMMYRSGATVTSEAWDNSLKSNASFSHPWGSAPGCWLVKGLFGISPTSGGYRTFDMKLQPGGVGQASVKVPTLQGEITAAYQLDGNGGMTLQVTVPANSQARVLIPDENGGGNSLIVDNTSMQAERVENRYLAVTLGSGNHTISGGSGSYIDTSEMKQNENVVYRTYGSSWGSYETDGNMSGTVGNSQALYRLQVYLNSQEDGGIRYSTHVQSYGWRDWCKDGEIDNVSDKMIQAVKIELTGNATAKYDIYYRVYCQTYGWLDWAKNGGAAGTIGLNKRAEAIEIVLVEKGKEPPGSTDVPFRQSGELNYSVHSQTYGWMNTVLEGATAGTVGESKRLEAIKIDIDSTKLSYNGGIQYQVHCQTYGWMDWVSDGKIAGTSGQSKRLEAIKIQLTGEMAEHYDIYYRVHAQTYGWLDWAKNGEMAGTSGQSKRLEAIQIMLVTKDGMAPGSTERPYIGKISYTTHVQSYGWQKKAYDGEMSGTSGQAKRLEGICIELGDQQLSGSVRYRTHVQSYGWQGWVSDGQLSGTTGQAKRLEAIQIELTGEAAKQYNIYYRVHCQTYGWLGWAQNGEPAGSSGMSKRLEAIEIKIVPKDTVIDTGGTAYYASDRGMLSDMEINSDSTEPADNELDEDIDCENHYDDQKNEEIFYIEIPGDEE